MDVFHAADVAFLQQLSDFCPACLLFGTSISSAHNLNLHCDVSILHHFGGLHKFWEGVGLAVVLTEIPTREAEDSFVNWTDEAFSDRGEHFDFVYILSHRFCIYYNLKKKCTQKWDIKDVYMQLRMIGKKLANNEISMDVLKKESIQDYIAKTDYCFKAENINM